MDRQEHRVERRLAAIFAADVAGYSRLMNQDEVETLRILTAHRQIMDQFIAEYSGRIANTAGDSVLAEFPQRCRCRSMCHCYSRGSYASHSRDARGATSPIQNRNTCRGCDGPRRRSVR
jgi:class 3 adenylate cyclase